MFDIKLSNLFKGDKTLWSIYGFLILISIVEVFSSGSSLSFKSGNYLDPLWSHGGYILGGWIVILITHHIPCRYFHILGFGGLTLVIALLIFTLMVSVAVNGGARWIKFDDFSFQPSELIKPTLISVVASLLSKIPKSKNRGNTKRIFGVTLTITGISCSLILTQNFSTAAILGVTILVMMYASELPWKWLLGLTGIGVMALLLFFVLAFSGALSSVMGRSSTWVARIERFHTDETKDPLKNNRPDWVDFDKGGQEAHAKIAIATSHVLGKFPGNSVQREHLPLAHTDFIYAIIIEEMGIFGGFVVLFLYCWMFFSCIRIAYRCSNPYPVYLILGLGTIILIQALVNMAVAVGAIPITGQNLPFVSRGGSSMLSTSIMYGMMLSVSRFARRSTPPKAANKLSEVEKEAAAIEENFRTL